MRLRHVALLAACVFAPACASEVEERPADVAALKGDRGFSDARAKLDEIRGDLASNQAHLRGVLTPAQTTAYAAAFWKLDRVAAAREDHAKKAIALAASLAKETQALTSEKPSKGCISPAKQAKVRDLYEAAQDLADAGVIGSGPSAPAHAVDAFYAAMAKDPGALRCLGKDLGDLEKDLGKNHAQKILQIKLEQPELDDVGVVKAAFETVAVASPVAAAVAASLERFAATQDGAALRRERPNDPVAKTAGAVLALMHLGALAKDAASGNYEKLVRDALEGGADDLASIAEAVAMLEGVFESGRAQSFVARTAAFSKLAGRVAGGVGVVTSLVALVDDIEGYRGDRLMYVARIAADAAALQAAIVALAEIGALGPASAAIVLLTQTVIVIADYWHARAAANRRNADTKALLRAVGLRPAVADVLADADRGVLRALTERRDGGLGLDPTEVQALAELATGLTRGPEALFLLPDDVRWIGGAAELRRLFSLSSVESLDMVRRTTGATDGVMARVAFDGCVPGSAGVYASRGNALAAIDACASRASAADERAALQRLGAYLRTR
ncbi:MAG: hypothetical protein JNL38_23285 [Myxococcales bacterium]|nr:hypothetical protein [Myxococcales bacterium]